MSTTSEQIARLKILADAAYADYVHHRINQQQFDATMDQLETQQAKLKSVRKAKMIAADTAIENRYSPPRVAVWCRRMCRRWTFLPPSWLACSKPRSVSSRTGLRF
jgi:hypothetical protein